MRKLNLLVCILLFPVMIVAQPAGIDSLQNAFSRAGNDLDKVRLLNQIANAYRSAEPAKTTQYATEALKLARKISFKAEEGHALLNLGNANVILGNYPQALKYFHDAQSVFERQSDTGDKSDAVLNGLARAYGSIGIVFSEQSNYSKALQFHLKAAKISERQNDDLKTARIYNNIGVVYMSQGDLFKALDYYIKCLDLQEKTGDKTRGFTLTNIGNIYLKQQNTGSAFTYYQKAQQLFDKYPDQRGIGELYNNIGLYYQQIGRPDQALDALAKALSAFNSISDKFGASDTYAARGKIYFDAGNLDEALINVGRSLELGKSLGVWERIQDSEKMLSEIYEKKGMSDRALEHFRNYSVARDSVSNYQNIRNSVSAEMNYDFERKEALQKKEQEKRELIYTEQAKMHKQQILFIVLFILLIFGIVFLINNRRQLKKNLTLQKELAEYEQKALHLQMNPHFVFNCLGSISSFIVQNGTDSAIKYLSKFSKLMRLTLEYSKESLIPIDKEIDSLQNYLELEQLRFNNVFDFTITKSDAIEDDMALPPLLLQPFVENAIIHGLVPRKDAGLIAIDFAIDKECLVCTITDNGIGFNKSQALKENLVSVHKSMALDITKKRLEMMEAYTSRSSKVEIKELIGEGGEPAGTKVVLSLPIQYIKDKVA